MAQEMSAGLIKLLREPAHCQIATLLPSGWPQLTQVWADTDGKHILINTAEGRQKVTDVRRDPRVAVNVVDATNAWRIASVRGRVVEVTTEGADDLIDALAKKYIGKDKYPFRQPGEVRVTLKIEPEKIHSLGLD
ncbi:MAG: PPOX class F420-dependent oxidoreductase [Chloroflexota bacterium]